MFGLSWGQIAIILLVAVFVLGPERIPTAVTWVMTTLRKARTMAAGAQAELRREIGPELDELRRQVADLQSLKEIQELRDLRDLSPKRLIGKNILGDEFSGGITGFLGLNEPLAGANGSAGAPGGSAAAGGAAGVAGAGVAAAAVADDGAAPAVDAGQKGGNGPHLPPSMLKTQAPATMKLPAPKVVGVAGLPKAPVPLADGERPPFDPDGT
jgi:sec-independent protein translocase protein TatB